VTAVLAAVLAAGCGGAGETGPSEQALPAPVAEGLAGRADEVAARLATGDACAAAGEADDLLHEAVQAVNDGRVPSPLQEELLASANELVESIECVPAEPAGPPRADDDDDRRDKDNKDKDNKDKDNKDRDEGPPGGEPPGKGKGKGRG
jgi:hypothetical protein